MTLVSLRRGVRYVDNLVAIASYFPTNATFEGQPCIHVFAWNPVPGFQPCGINAIPVEFGDWIGEPGSLPWLVVATYSDCVSC